MDLQAALQEVRKIVEFCHAPNEEALANEAAAWRNVHRQLSGIGRPIE